jgi:hypothetical protein
VLTTTCETLFFNKEQPDFMMRIKMPKRILLDNLTRKLMKGLELNFQSNVDVPRIKHGKNQTIETLINEEALLLAKFLRTKIKMWIPRKVKLKLSHKKEKREIL